MQLHLRDKTINTLFYDLISKYLWAFNCNVFVTKLTYYTLLLFSIQFFILGGKQVFPVADSLSVANDLERLFPRGPGYFHHTTWLRNQTLDHRNNKGTASQISFLSEQLSFFSRRITLIIRFILFSFEL